MMQSVVPELWLSTGIHPDCRPPSVRGHPPSSFLNSSQCGLNAGGLRISGIFPRILPGRMRISWILSTSLPGHKPVRPNFTPSLPGNVERITGKEMESLRVSWILPEILPGSAFTFSKCIFRFTRKDPVRIQQGNGIPFGFQRFPGNCPGTSRELPWLSMYLPHSVGFLTGKRAHFLLAVPYREESTFPVFFPGSDPISYGFPRKNPE